MTQTPAKRTRARTPNNKTTTVKAGQEPVAVAINEKTNKIYVANVKGKDKYGNSDPNAPGTVTVIDGRTNKTISVKAGHEPAAIAVNEKTNKIYAANQGSNDLTVIGETNDYPRAVEMVRAGLDPRVEARLREVLIDAAGDPEAGDALLRFFNTTRFMPVDPESQEALDRISEGVARVRAEVE